MLDLLEQQELLKRKKFWWQSAFYAHFVTLGLCLGGVAIIKDSNDAFGRYIAIAMLIAVLYVILFGFGWFIPKIEENMRAVRKELTTIGDRIIESKEINKQLDERRDKLIFDEDEEYWTILEKLEQA